MPQLQRRRLGVGILFLAAMIGLALSLYAYLTPLSGVTGTLGALVAVLACAILAATALLLLKLRPGAGRVIVCVLVLLGLVGTFFAALLLHQWLLSAVLVIGLAGLVIDVAQPSSRTSSPKTSASRHPNRV